MATPDLAGADLVRADLHGAWIRESDLRGLRIRGCDLTGTEIDGEVDTLVVNGVEVGPLVKAELDRRHPERAALRATDAAGFRAGWAGLEAMWARTMDRVAALPPATVDESVDGEFTFAQTLRHLVFATDLWVGGTILGRSAPHHPIGVPFSGWDEEAAELVDLTATPSWDEVLWARSSRVTLVRDTLSTLTDADFERMGPPPSFMPDPTVTFHLALWIIMNEEWHHHRYAVRDLSSLGSVQA